MIILARDGYKDSLDAKTEGYVNGDVSKDELEKILCVFQKSNDDMKSEMRSKAKIIYEQGQAVALLWCMLYAIYSRLWIVIGVAD